MNSPIVFVELHLLVRLILKPYTPATLLTAAKRNTFSKFVFRKPLMTLLSELIIINLLDGELPPFNIGLTTWQSQR